MNTPKPNYRAALAAEKAAHTATAQELHDAIAERDALQTRLSLITAELHDLRAKLHAGQLHTPDNPRWTPRTQSALALAAKEAQEQGSTYVGTEHVLLGLLKQGEGIAHRHFLAAGLDYSKVAYAMRVGRCS